MARTVKLRLRLKLSRILGTKRKRNTEDIISEKVNQTPSHTIEAPVDDYPDIPSETDTFGSDISIATYITDTESAKELDLMMQPDYDCIVPAYDILDDVNVDSFSDDCENTSEPVTNKKRELIDVDIRKWCPTVYNQKEERSCVAIATADVTTGVLRKEGVLDEKTVLSPQPLIDSGIIADKDSRRLDIFVGDSKLGFRSVKTYGFLGMERPFQDWSWKKYRRSRHKRYNICQLRETFKSKDPGVNHNKDGPIIDELEANFRKGGKQYPLVCSLDFSALKDRKVAAKHGKGGNPYHHKKDKKKQQLRSGGDCESPEIHMSEDHAVVIVGYNNKSRSCLKRYVTIVNSHGSGWGADGYTEIGLDAIDSLIVPVYSEKRWRALQKLTEMKSSSDVHVHGAGSSSDGKQARGTLARSKHAENEKSCTSEAGVSKYSMSVDSEAYKVLGGISRASQDPKHDSVEEGIDNVQVEGTFKKERGPKLSPFTTMELSFQALNVQSSDEPDQEADWNDEIYASGDEECSQYNDGNDYNDVKDSTTLVSQPHLDSGAYLSDDGDSLTPSQISKKGFLPPAPDKPCTSSPVPKCQDLPSDQTSDSPTARDLVA